MNSGRRSGASLGLRREAGAASREADAGRGENKLANPLLVVSNRLPYTVRRREGRLTFTRAPGGLVSALTPVLSERGGRWIGWPGLAEEDLAAAGGLPPFGEEDPVSVPVMLSREEVAQYYGQFSNRTIWPVFHYFLDHARWDAGAWRFYDRVNERFAEVAAREGPEQATFWLQDYQLLRAPHHLRIRRPDARIAHFLHIPFPAADVFRALPWSRLLLRGMLGADYLGFQTPTYAEHFMSAAERLLGCEILRDRGEVHFEGRLVTVGADPISIDVGAMEFMARQALVREPPEPNVRLILGVDRLDYTKGLHQRMLAVERLLERRPDYRGRIVFLQVAVPSRERVPEYGRLKREVDEDVGRINGRFSEAGWSPIRYVSRSLDQATLAGLYATAEVALVTPIRDGMNLVAKEFVAAQVGEPGVLILSELAGAAEELQEAVQINPFDVDGIADALDVALQMPREERYARMSALRDRVRASDVDAWARRLLGATARAAERARTMRPTQVELLTRRLGPWLSARERTALFLDYDGTLTPIVAHPDQARLDSDALQALEAVLAAQHIDVTVVSGRELENLRDMLPGTGLTLVGNHGFEIDGPGVRWRHPEAEQQAETLARAAAALDELRVPGAWIEAKGVTISWHVREVPKARRRDALRQARALLEEQGLRAVAGKAVLEARPDIDWHKGRAVLLLQRLRYGTDWPSRARALYLGDDRTDEDAFRSLHGIGRSIRVGSPGETTVADYMLPDPSAVARLLRWLAAGGHLGMGA